MTVQHPITTFQVYPAASEHAPYAATYLAATADALATSGGTLEALLETQPAALKALLADVPEAVAQRGYAPGKWTLLESLVHVADTERVFAYRLMRIARGDQTPLPGFDQDAWVPLSGANTRSLASVVHEIVAVRQATLALLTSLEPAVADRTGTASGQSVTARALVWMIAGHFAHHLTLTRTHYLGANLKG